MMSFGVWAWKGKQQQQRQQQQGVSVLTTKMASAYGPETASTNTMLKSGYVTNVSNMPTC
jgi:hypothetical protein